jgi:hypothetical protein
LFVKGQWLKKLENRGVDVKKAQMIAEVPLCRTFEDMVFATYFMLVLRTWTKDSTLLYSRMNPEQLSDWYGQHWTPGSGCTANDYTGWDSGVDRVFLQFDLWLMRKVGLPEIFVDRHYDYRVNSRTHVGAFPIMQASGDRWTWDLNTVRNAALTGASLHIPAGTVAAFCGDDSAVLGRFARARHFIPRQWPMVPKTVIGKQVDFCGYSFGRGSLCLSAKSLAYRAGLALKRGQAQSDFWRSVDESIPMVDTDDHDAMNSLGDYARCVESLKFYRFTNI